MISKNIKRARVAKELSQAELGAMLGLNQSSIAAWEIGRAVPSSKNLLKLAEVLSVPVENLTGTTLPYNAEQRMIARLSNSLPPKKAVLPLGGRIHAGDSIHVSAVTNADEFPVPYHIWEGHKNGMVLEVVGTCMNKVYPEGCHVVVDPDLAVESGHIGAFELNGEFVMRRFIQTRQYTILAAESFDEFDDILLKDGDELRGVGRVVWFQAAEELDK